MAVTTKFLPLPAKISDSSKTSNYTAYILPPVPAQKSCSSGNISKRCTPSNHSVTSTLSLPPIMATGQIVNQKNATKEQTIMRPSPKDNAAYYPIGNIGRNSGVLKYSPSSSTRANQYLLSLNSQRLGNATFATADPQLTVNEVENVLRQKIGENVDTFKKIFRMYDVSRCGSITKGEFRLVLNNYCLPLTTAQFKALMMKVTVNPHGTIPYLVFLRRFTSRIFTPPSNCARPKSFDILGNAELGMIDNCADIQRISNKRRGITPPHEPNIDFLERQLRAKLAEDPKTLIKHFRLFDYNRVGEVRRHEVHRLIDTYYMKLTEAQFNKLWSRYYCHHDETINYRDFLNRLGVGGFTTGERKLTTKNLQFNGAKVELDPMKQLREREKSAADSVRERDEKKQSTGYRVQLRSIHAIEKEFRKRIRTNYENIRKAMMTFDTCGDGFIAIKDLQAVLDNFVLPTSDDVFRNLMNRFGVRGTGRVSWEKFLAKFFDQLSDSTGQTLGVGYNHKVNRIRQSVDKSSTGEILEILRRHVMQNYSSLKQAFLAFDESRKGVITSKDLRRMTEKLTTRLNDENFKELMAILDPFDTGLIRFRRFAEIFDAEESPTAHKWLDSNRKLAKKQLPIVLAWSTIQEMLRNNFLKNYKQIMNEVASHGDPDKGSITKKHLRFLIDRYAIALHDEHFNKLWNDCEKIGKDRINLFQFFHNLGIEIQPGDIEGVSTSIHNDSNAREIRRQSDQKDRIDDIERNNFNHTRMFSANDVISKLKQKMNQSDIALRNAFIRHSKSKKGRITTKDLRKMLEDIGLLMYDKQFQELVEYLKLDERGLDYSDFLVKFEDPRGNGMTKVAKRTQHHSGDQSKPFYLDADQCYGHIAENIRQNFQSVKTAFYNIDDDHDSIVSMPQFRKLLNSFMYVISDEVFCSFLRMMGLNMKSTLSYQSFLKKFENIDKEEGHPWLNSTHRFNKALTSELVADKVHDCLRMKAEQAWADLSNAFRCSDSSVKGIIKKKEMRSVLLRLSLPMSDVQFDLLWARYDPDDKGYVTHKQFCKKLGVNLTPGDDQGYQGTSRKMVDENHANVQAHHASQRAKHQEMASKQIRFSQSLQPDIVERELKDNFRGRYSSFDKAFRDIDENKDGFITLADLRRVLCKLNYFLDEDQFSALLKRLGLPASNNRISYFDFLRAIDDGRASKFSKKIEIPKENPLPSSYDNLSTDKAIDKLKKIITANVDNLKSAFVAIDRYQTDSITLTEFRRLLDNFCFRLTDSQFKALLKKCRLGCKPTADGDKKVNWVVFLQDFSSSKQLVNRPCSSKTNMRPPTPFNPSSAEIEEKITNAVHERYDSLLRAFEEADYSQISLVSKQDFRDILNDQVMILTTSQLDHVWSKLPLDASNHLYYREFLKKYLGDSDRIKGSMKNTLKETVSSSTANSIRDKDSVDSLSSRPASSLKSGESAASIQSGSPIGASHTMPAIVDAQAAEARLKPTVYKNWKTIQRECRKLDPNDTGTVFADEFVGIMDRYGVMLPLDDARQLMVKYSVEEMNGKFSYRDFLRHFVLTLKPQDEKKLTKRLVLREADSPPETGKETKPFSKIMLKLRDRILDCWKEMRRRFRMIDSTFEGYVSCSTFRQVLREFSVDLTEEEFFHLLSYYDYQLVGRVPYNEFFRAFLQ